MHPYAVFGHDRVKIGRWLGVASILIAGGVSSFVEWSSEHVGFLAFVEGSIGTGAVYFLLHYLFNNFAWKIPFFKIPDLTGNWNFTGRTLNDDGTVKYEWEGVAGIKQTWKDISIHLKTEKSQSFSYTATLSRIKNFNGGWQLSYSYSNEPELEQSHELYPHKGFCEIDFDELLELGKAQYFNKGSRRTFGIIDFKRVTQ